jgi:hypothetical protein
MCVLAGIAQQVMREYMKMIMALIMLSMIVGCVIGPPELTLDQERRLYDIKIFMAGSKPDKNFNPVGEIYGIDCSGTGGSPS